MAIADAKNKEFVCRLNGVSIYWSSRFAKKDKYRFILIEKGKQIYDTEDFFGAIHSSLGNKKVSSIQKKKLLQLAKEFDEESIKYIKKNL